MASTASPVHHVVIVGAGFSGTLQAINLLRHAGPRATLIERAPAPARGIAYSAAHRDHLLNVRASKMSAFPDEEDHFVRWLAARTDYSGSSFVPRLVYGDYLSDLLQQAVAKSGDRLRIVSGEAVDLELENDRPIIRMDDGTSIAGDAVVLALGNLPPHDPPGLDAEALPGLRYVRDPWSPVRGEGLCDDDTVLLLGSGLTMVDTALLLHAEGFRGRIVAMSRRGLAPRRHVDGPQPGAGLGERPPITASALVRAVRGRARGIGWRAAVDELRPFTQALWRAASDEVQSRFLRHLRPWWDVHRHRIAPAVADRIEAMQAAGQLRIVAGKLLSAAPAGDGVAVEWRPRGRSDGERLNVARIINCTGPQGDLLRTDQPLLRSLLAKGLVRPDPHRLGLDVTADAQVIGRDGRPSPSILALGPMTRGCFWEIVAVPDIRTQTWSVARYLSNAHWVGGEGL